MRDPNCEGSILGEEAQHSLMVSDQWFHTSGFTLVVSHQFRHICCTPLPNVRVTAAHSGHQVFAPALAITAMSGCPRRAGRRSHIHSQSSSSGDTISSSSSDGIPSMFRFGERLPEPQLSSAGSGRKTSDPRTLITLWVPRWTAGRSRLCCRVMQSGRGQGARGKGLPVEGAERCCRVGNGRAVMVRGRQGG